MGRDHCDPLLYYVVLEVLELRVGLLMKLLKWRLQPFASNVSNNLWNILWPSFLYSIKGPAGRKPAVEPNPLNIPYFPNVPPKAYLMSSN